MDDKYINAAEAGKKLRELLQDFGVKCVKEFLDSENQLKAATDPIKEKPLDRYFLLNKENAENWIRDHRKQGLGITYTNDTFADGKDYPIQAFSDGDIFQYYWEEMPPTDPDLHTGCSACDEQSQSGCRECLERYESERKNGIDYKEGYERLLDILNRYSPDLIKMENENTELKKSNALHKSREERLLREIEKLKEPYNAKTEK